MKRLLTLLAFVALTITANAVIQSGSCGDNVAFVLNDDGTLVISGSGEMKNGSYSSHAPWYENREEIIKVQIEDGVTSIGYEAFYKCSNLTSITIPKSVVNIGDYAFYGCSSLTSVIIPNFVTSIGSSAFWGCHHLTSVTIGNSLTSIGEEAFKYCWELKEIYSQAITPPKAYTSTFYGISKNDCKLYVLVGTKEAYTSANAWKEFTSIIEPNTTSIVKFIDQNGNNYEDGSTMDIYPSLVIPEIPDFFEFKCPELVNTSATAVNVKLEINIKQLPAGTQFAECFSGACTNHVKEGVFTTKAQNLPGNGTLPTACEWLYDETLAGKTCIADFTLYVNNKKDKTVTVRYINNESSDSNKKCDAPAIEYVDGHLKFSSTTPNATYSYTITDDDIKTSLTKSTSGDIPLSTTYNITVYADAEGYDTSEASTRTLQFGGNSGTEDVEALKAQIQSLQTQNSALESKVSKLMTENESLVKEISTLESKNTNLVSENSTLKTANETLIKENSALESKNKELIFEVSGLKDDMKTLESENSALESENASLKETNKMYAEGDLNLDGRTNIDDVVYLLKMDSYSSDADALALLLDGSTAITLSEITDKYGDVEFYTLNGVKVNIPNQTGIYIVKKNGETKMVVVKK